MGGCGPPDSPEPSGLGAGPATFYIPGSGSRIHVAVGTSVQRIRRAAGLTMQQRMTGVGLPSQLPVEENPESSHPPFEESASPDHFTHSPSGDLSPRGGGLAFLGPSCTLK